MKEDYEKGFDFIKTILMSLYILVLIETTVFLIEDIMDSASVTKNKTKIPGKMK